MFQACCARKEALAGFGMMNNTPALNIYNGFYPQGAQESVGGDGLLLAGDLIQF